LAGNDSPCAFDDDSWQRAAVLDGKRVLVTLIGEKRGAVLVVEGEELKL